MDRRQFIKLLSLSPLPFYNPALWANLAEKQRKVLVLLELKGGNDGLNTLVPYKDPLYYKLRPNIRIKEKQVLTLGDSRNPLGFNPTLAPLIPAWENNELAILQGVGYPKPNLSHFRSIEIWDTGSSSNQYLDDGWLTQAFQINPPQDAVSNGLSLGFDTGPLGGINSNTIAINNPRQFFQQARLIKTMNYKTENSALAHILKVQDEIQQAALEIRSRLRKTKPIKSELKFPLAKQLNLVANMIHAQIPLPVIKVSHSGFDTHSNQLNKHNRLLSQLGQALAEFRNALIQTDRWDQVLLLTYSEFGRRPAENASRGTDHGTSAPHFVMGGNVKGGFYGQQPRLSGLNYANMQHHLDFRSVYATVLRKWFQQIKIPSDLDYPVIKFLA